jgi:glyoxylase-like metal-dependent hydrolase (beta-lactamase superfamily II)
MTVLVKDADIEIERLTLGPWGTNAYIVLCPATRHSVLIDTPAEAGKVREHLKGSIPRYILLTHNHADHLGALASLYAALKVPLAVHAADAVGLPVRPDVMLNDGDEVAVGNLSLEVWHTPGHTPGSLCFLSNRYLISGDTLFPGGPGKTGSPAAFQQILRSISGKIMTLPDDTRIFPGHGEPTTVQQAKDEFSIFSARPHRPDLCGDVLWLKD